MTYDTRKGWAGGNQLIVGDSATLFSWALRMRTMWRRRSKVQQEVSDAGLFRAGRMLGQARAIQKYRADGKLGQFCADSAWEMGE